MIKADNLIAGKIVSGTQFRTNITPVDGGETSTVSFLSEEDLVDVFTKAREIKGKEAKKDYSELFRLAQFIKENYVVFTEQIIKDSGFVQKDAEDLVNCSIEFCEDYPLHLRELISPDLITSFSFKEGSNQRIKLTSLPFGLISVTTPRNTPLITELTVIVHALWSGNVLVLRPSPGVAGTVALLLKGILESFNPETLESLNIVFADAQDFVKVSLDYANLLHYIGSTKYLENTLIAGIKKGVKVLVDGDGCSVVLVDSTADIEKAVKACYKGLIRCNGEICISVRVIVVERKIYEKFRSRFLNLIEETEVGIPGLNKESEMGPLFSPAQAENIINVAKEYKLLYGQLTPLEYGSNYISPVVVELEPTDNTFLKKSVFGPIVGLSYFEGDNWKRWLEENHINLTDAIFSTDKEFIKEFIATSKSPRKVINLDPTMESVFEPWGAFLPSGWNDVSYWYFKYRNFFQLITDFEQKNTGNVDKN